MKSHLLIALIGLAVCGLRAADADEPKPFTIQTILGETFRNCHVIKVTPAALTLAHDYGVTKIPFNLLADEWKKLFHYDPDKAREFEKQEARQRQLAEEKSKALNRERERRENKHMAQLEELEKQQLAEQARREKEWQEAVARQATAANAGPVPPLAPYPGDPKQQGVVTTTEVVVPPVTPIGTPYTPGVGRSQTYVYPNSAGYYVVPGNGGIFITPGQGYPNNYCPPNNPRSGVSGQISVGPTVIRVGP
jgi:hypothetical protein